MATRHAELLPARSAARRSGHGHDSTSDQHGRHPLLRLQGKAGNAAVARMIQAEHDAALAQRQEMPEEEEELQMFRDTSAPTVGLEGGALDAGVEQRIDDARGGGGGLANGVRGSMEHAFGTSFEDVRVHRDQESDALARSMTAKAFTTGSDVFLREDASPNDSHLMAHELTHVVQQRSMEGAGQMTVRPAGDAYEQEADAVAGEVARYAMEESDQA